MFLEVLSHVSNVRQVHHETIGSYTYGQEDCGKEGSSLVHCESKKTAVNRAIYVSPGERHPESFSYGYKLGRCVSPGLTYMALSTAVYLLSQCINQEPSFPSLFSSTDGA